MWLPEQLQFENIEVFHFTTAEISVIIPICGAGIIIVFTSIFSMSNLIPLPTRLNLVWMLRSFFQSIPLSLEEAALIDGVNQLQAMVRIVVLLAMPGIISSAIFTFVLVWNEYTLALFF